MKKTLLAFALLVTLAGGAWADHWSGGVYYHDPCYGPYSGGYYYSGPVYHGYYGPAYYPSYGYSGYYSSHGGYSFGYSTPGFGFSYHHR